MTTTDHEGLTMNDTTHLDRALDDAVRRVKARLEAETVQPVEIVKRPETVSGAVVKAAGSVAWTALGGWELMLLAGGIHATVPAVPAVGYWTAVMVLLTVSALGYTAGLRPFPVRELPRATRR